MFCQFPAWIVACIQTGIYCVSTQLKKNTRKKIKNKKHKPPPQKKKKMLWHIYLGITTKIKTRTKEKKHRRNTKKARLWKKRLHVSQENPEVLHERNNPSDKIDHLKAAIMRSSPELTASHDFCFRLWSITGLFCANTPEL